MCKYFYLQRFSVSTRQRQLAALTPSQLIELAYLSALLEMYPSDKSQPVSHKVEVIKTFLENVVHVVPLESIAHAIAYSPSKVAKLCTKALFAYKIELPGSPMMCDGLKEATLHLRNAVAKSALKANTRHLNRTSVIFPTKFVRQQSSCSVNSSRPFGSGYTATTNELEEPDGEDAKHLPQQEDVQKLQSLQRKVMEKSRKTKSPKLISEASIEHLYHTSSHSTSQKSGGVFVSPLDILRQGNSTLTQLSEELTRAAEKSTRSNCNAQMLLTVNEIRSVDLAICTALLGGFMEQQKVIIPLVKSRSDQSSAFSVKGSASVGVWALASLKYDDIHPILSQCHGNKLLVRIENHMKAIISQDMMLGSKKEDKQYAAKLQFIVQGLVKTVTCNSQYVSYSLERQLKDICKEQNIDGDTPVEDFRDRWSTLFRKNILSLVACSHHSLITRWMKWALMVHNLREKLAEYTAVGVVGLVNSGKSMLVSSLFKITVITTTFSDLMLHCTEPFYGC